MRNKVDLNLDTLQREVLDHLEAAGFAVFYSVPSALHEQSPVLWNSLKFPDYRAFLDVAAKAGIRMILFAAQEFEEDDVEELTSHMEASDMTREERRECENGLRKLRVYLGRVCSLELGFNLEGRLYVFQVQPDWYEQFQDIEDEILGHLDEEDGDEDDRLGPYFSRN
jgi:hypothetical protein